MNQIFNKIKELGLGGEKKAQSLRLILVTPQEIPSRYPLWQFVRQSFNVREAMAFGLGIVVLATVSYLTIKNNLKVEPAQLANESTTYGIKLGKANYYSEIAKDIFMVRAGGENLEDNN